MKTSTRNFEPNAKNLLHLVCPEQELVVELLIGQLPIEQHRTLELHLDACPRCWAAAAAARSLASRPLTQAWSRAELGHAFSKLVGAIAHLASLQAGTSLGRYILRRRIGIGGMGVVYAAHDPDLEREVAIKILLPGIRATVASDDQLLREARAVARVSHSNVITVHDVNTVDGQVVVTMELVEGEDLRSWLRSHQPTWREIVKLFVQAGRGLAAAHAAGVIHRDFKPSNVLVSKTGVVKVIDFGLAWTNAIAGSEPRSRTPEGWFAGTPAYMAPEQRRGEPCDARSDQFSFCVALYESLFGVRPSGEHDDQPEVAPSGNRSEARTRAHFAIGAVPSRIRKALARGLAHSPRDRHPSLDSLVAALAHDPRRAWQSALASSALGVALFISASVGYRVIQTRAQLCRGAERKLSGIWDADRQHAIHRALAATNVSYAEDTFTGVRRVLDRFASSWIAMDQNACEATHVRGEQSELLLDRRMQCLDRRRDELCAVVHELEHADRNTVAKAVEAASSLGSISDCADAKRLHAEPGLPEREPLRSEVVKLRAQLAQANAKQRMGGRPGEALPLVERVLAEARPLGYRPIEAEALYIKGRLEIVLGRYGEGEQTLYQALWAAEASRLDELAANAWSSLLNLSAYHQRRLTEAERLVPHAVAAVERVGQGSQAELQFLGARGNLFSVQDKFDQALADFQRAATLGQRLLPEDDPFVSKMLGAAGVEVEELGRYNEAAAFYEQARRLQERSLGSHHPDLARTLENLGIVSCWMGHYDDALSYHSRALAIFSESLGAEHDLVAEVLEEIALVYQERGDDLQAIPHHLQAIKIARARLGGQHPTVADYEANLGITHLRLGQLDEAHRLIEHALVVQERAYGKDNPLLADTRLQMAMVLEAENESGRAVKLDRQARQVLERTRGSRHHEVALTLLHESISLRKMHRFPEALARAQEALEIDEAALGKDHVGLFEALTALGWAQLQVGKAELAKESFERATRLLQQRGGRNALDRAGSEFGLARALSRTGGDQGRVRRLARAAYNDYLQGGPMERRNLAAVEAWLAAREM